MAAFSFATSRAPLPLTYSCLLPVRDEESEERRSRCALLEDDRDADCPLPADIDLDAEASLCLGPLPTDVDLDDWPSLCPKVLKASRLRPSGDSVRLLLRASALAVGPLTPLSLEDSRDRGGVDLPRDRDR
jgi:hypothetical protein